MIKPSEALNRFHPIKQLPIAAQTSKAEEQLRYGFRTGDIGLIMDEALGSEIVNNIPICSIPDTPPWFSGVVNLRGNIVPIFDLKMIFNSNEKTNLQKILLIGKESKVAGILIDELPQALPDLDYTTDLSSVPPILNECLRSVYKQNENIWLELNFNDFFTGLGLQFSD
ncbi:MAG: chemotaxis protein CheW [Gammaproteobacteria bacterium]